MEHARPAPAARPPDRAPAAIRSGDAPAVAVFARHGVPSERELEARYEVFVEQYATRIGIEGAIAAQMARTLLVPAALPQRRLIESAGGPLVGTLTDELDEVRARAPRARRGAARDDRRPRAADRLETLVADELWPLPRYAEMLYLR